MTEDLITCRIKNMNIPLQILYKRYITNHRNPSRREEALSK